MKQNQIDLSPQQVMSAAAAGIQLLNTPGAVSVPGPMAVTDVVKVLNSLLTAIVNGQVVVVNPAQLAKPPEGDKTPPEGDGEQKDADQKPDLKSVGDGKEATKQPKASEK